MPHNHSSIGIAQTIFYIPAIPVTSYILVKNWAIGPRISRLTWLTLTILSLLRITGGILVIVRESQQNNIALAITTVVILNVGLVPLIMSTLGIISLAISGSTDTQHFIQKTTIIFRILFITALTLLLAGAAISLHGNATGDHLVQAAYIVFVIIVCIICGNILYLQQMRKYKLVFSEESIIYINGATLAIPFLILRIVYGVLSAFLSPDIWSPVIGSSVVFALMALLPEYIIMVGYSYLGWYRFRKFAGCAMRDGGDDNGGGEMSGRGGGDGDK